MKQGWEIKKILDVVVFQRGLTYSKKDEVDFSSNIVLRSNNVDLKTNKLDFKDLKYINPEIIIPENKKVTKGSLIICTANGSKSHLGKVALIDEDYDYAFGGFMGLIKPTETLNSNFLFHFMTSDTYKNFIGALSNGANINNLKFGDLGELEIPLPSLPEQQNIVAILDKAFAVIAKAKANAEQNLKNAKELFESYLQGVFENKGEGWEEKKLGDVVDFFNGFAFKSKDAIETSNTQLIRMGNLYQNQLNLDRRAVFYPDDFAVTYKKYLLEGNDLIISLTGTSDKEDYGYTVRIPENEYNLLLNQRIAKISIKNEKATNKDYLFHFLLSRTFLDKLYKTANGTRQANLSTETMKGLSIAIPNIKQQQIIVQKLDALSAETKKLEAIYQQKIKDLEELKKSILQKAFAGELKTEKTVAV